MICPRWTPRATATLANLGDSSRQCSSRHVLRPSKDAASRPRRGFSTVGGSGGDGGSDSPPRKTSQSLNSTQRTSPRPTASHPLPRQRTWTPAASTASALDRRSRNQPNTGEARRPRNPFSRRQSIQNPRGSKESSLVMLIIDGMSPNLNAADFYRITPNDLSDWQSAIKKVQQQRKVDTLEPLGRYWVTFGSGEAAASYRDRLVRLHKLNGFKLQSASGLWESSVPSSLKVSLATPSAAAETSDALTSDTPSTETLVDIVNTFTIAPGSQAILPIQRRKVSLLRPWTNRLAGLVENLGYGERPPTLMVDIYPPTLTAQELHQFIRRDGQTRGLRWQVSLPQHLKTSGSQRGSAKTTVTRETGWNDEVDAQEGGEDKQRSPFFWRSDRETLEKLKGRFVLACADETEARRFQQSWNCRTLTTTQPEPARYLVHASIIKW
ncbi:hypothetical protein THARTR1_09756 [Trichoderma harzianum]|uniref:Uncharacterized protein n=1 Tax=Trichoderma harzianum TaxID=5544 RepID=A0A2K0TV73_TRIHA|nr:hypothetical protein THARTR1_09756 [Trichoderma harzianum]